MRPASEMLVALAAVRVALAVPALVVVGDRVGPLAEPRAQRRGEAGAELGVAADELPLLVARPPGLVEDLGRHLELADVVQERGPVEPVDLVAAEARAPSRSSASTARTRSEWPRVTRSCALRAATKPSSRSADSIGVAVSAPSRARCEALLEVVGRARAERRAEARRRLVGEHERELEQRRERQQPAGQPVDGDQHDRRGRAEPDPPGDRCPSSESPGRPDHAARDVDEADRRGDRREQHEGAQQRGHAGAAAPTRRRIAALVSVAMLDRLRHRHAPVGLEPPFGYGLPYAPRRVVESHAGRGGLRCGERAVALSRPAAAARRRRTAAAVPAAAPAGMPVGGAPTPGRPRRRSGSSERTH